jgi:hypothetical protein
MHTTPSRGVFGVEPAAAAASSALRNPNFACKLARVLFSGVAGTAVWPGSAGDGARPASENRLLLGAARGEDVAGGMSEKDLRLATLPGVAWSGSRSGTPRTRAGFGLESGTSIS